MAKYVALQRVQVWLENKVRFAGPGDQDPNKMTLGLLNELVSQAESQLEIDLMMRYEIPLQGVNGEVFSQLPQVTRIMLGGMAELLSAVRILETDFGRGTSANADKYTEKLEKRYTGLVKQLTETMKDSYQTWLRPPLPGLKLAYCNQADTGFKGRIYDTSTVTNENGSYAAQQINSPSENWFNGILDPLDTGDIFNPSIGSGNV